jgi:hypothetical protein
MRHRCAGRRDLHGLFGGDHRARVLPSGNRHTARASEGEDDVHRAHRRSERSLQTTIARLAILVGGIAKNRNLDSAAFKKDDATLYPEAGPCTTCPKRTGASPLLFPDLQQKLSNSLHRETGERLAFE